MLADQIQADLKTAMLAKDETRVSDLRMLISELKYANIRKGEEGGDDRNAISDEDPIGVVQKELKKRKESVESFRSGNRPELAEKEETEAEILKAYLPEQMSDEELTKLVEEAITKTGAT